MSPPDDLDAELLRDLLKAPTEDSFRMSKRVLVALTAFAALSAIARNGAAASMLLFCFAGASVGFFAFRRPVRALLVGYGLVSIGLLVSDGSDRWAAVAAIGIIFVPLAVVGALSAAVVKRWRRSRAALERAW